MDYWERIPPVVSATAGYLAGCAFIAAVLGLVALTLSRAKRARRRARDRRRDLAVHLHRVLGHAIDRFAGATEPTIVQAVSDAYARHHTAAWLLSHARTQRHYLIAYATAMQGLAFLRPAGVKITFRRRDVPPRPAQLAAVRITRQHTTGRLGPVGPITAGPRRTTATPFYHPGGAFRDRPIPAGYYSHPWWSEALHTGVWTAPALLAFESLFGSTGGGASVHSGFAGRLRPAVSG